MRLPTGLTFQKYRVWPGSLRYADFTKSRYFLGGLRLPLHSFKDYSDIFLTYFIKKLSILHFFGPYI